MCTRAKGGPGGGAKGGAGGGAKGGEGGGARDGAEMGQEVDQGVGRAQSYYNYRSHWAQYADNTQPYCKLVVMLYRPAGEVTKATMDSRIFHMCNARQIAY